MAIHESFLEYIWTNDPKSKLKYNAEYNIFANVFSFFFIENKKNLQSLTSIGEYFNMNHIFIKYNNHFIAFTLEWM